MFFSDCSSFLPTKAALHPNKFLNVYRLDLESGKVDYYQDIELSRPSSELKNIIFTPDKQSFVMIYKSQVIQTVSVGFTKNQDFKENFNTSSNIKTTKYLKEIPLYDNFTPLDCEFEVERDSESSSLLTCFLVQTDNSMKEDTKVDSVIITYDLKDSGSGKITPEELYKNFYHLRLTRKADLHDMDFTQISQTNSNQEVEKLMLIRVGQSVLDVFRLDKDYLSIKNDMVKNTVELKAYSNFAATENELQIQPKVNIKTLIIAFSIGFGVFMLVLFLCHFKFIKDNIVNKYKKYKLHENSRVNEDQFE